MKQQFLTVKSNLFKKELTIPIDEELKPLGGEYVSRKVEEANRDMASITNLLPYDGHTTFLNRIIQST